MLWFPYVKGKKQTLAQIKTLSVKQVAISPIHLSGPVHLEPNENTVYPTGNYDVTAYDFADIQLMHIGNTGTPR